MSEGYIPNSEMPAALKARIVQLEAENAVLRRSLALLADAMKEKEDGR